MRSSSCRALAVAFSVFAFAGVPAGGAPLRPEGAQFTFHAWDASHGLPQSSVQAIAQGRNGYLWVGTMGGLARFDGVQFRLFDKRTHPELRDNVIQALLAEGDRLWIGTGSGGLVVREGGAFRSVAGVPSDTIWGLEADREGRVWVATQGGLARIGSGALEATRIAAAGDEPFLAVDRDGRGAIWAGTESGTLYRFAGEATRTWTTADGIPAGAIRAIADAPDGSIWIGTEAGLARFDGERFERFTVREGLSSNVVRALRIDHHGELWVGTYGGLTRRTGDRFVRYTVADSDLPSDTVRALLEDREGNLWVGTGGGGLVRLKQAMIRSLTRAGALPIGLVRAVMEGSDGALWIGTFGDGAIIVRDGEGTALTTAEGLPDDVVFSFAEERDGSVWIGTRRGLARWSNGRLRRFGLADGLVSEVIRALYVDREGALWIGTIAGAMRYRDGRFEHFTREDGLASEAVFYITQTRDGAIWMATHGGGLHRWADGRFEGWGEKDGLPTGRVWSIHEDERGTIWLGSRGGGLIRFRDGRFFSFDTGDGMLDDVVYHVIEDDRGLLWMSGNKGIFAARREELDAYAEGRSTAIGPLSFGKAEGMRSPECNGGTQPAGWKGADGLIYFPTLAGIAVVDPFLVEPSETAPRTIIESLVVNGQPIDPADRMTIPPGAGRVEIGYTGLMLSAPERIVFRYRLEPLESEWIEAGTDRTARYTNLPAGQYRFSVVASELGGKLTSEASIGFTIRPQLWERPSFWAAAALVAAALVGLVVWWRGQRARRRERQLEQLVEQRTHELEIANQLLAAQSRADALTGLANRRHFDETIEREWRRAIRDRAWISLILADVDQFKAYNDAYGHQLGDECLQRIAAALRRTGHRPGDLVARYGGEEFAIILYGAEPLHVERIAESVRAVVEEDACPHETSTVASVVTISAGAASVRPYPGMVPKQLIALADELLYEAKRSGRNRVRCGVLEPELELNG